MPRIKRMLPAPLSVCIHLRDNLWRDERGGILILFVVILMVGGIAVDMMRYESERVRLQGTADRAVLAGSAVREVEGNPSPEDIIRSYFEPEGLGFTIAGDRLSVRTIELGARVVEVVPSGVRTTFLRLSGTDQLDMHLRAGAVEGLAEVDVEIVMVLDVSTSMLHFDRLDNFKEAAAGFVTSMLGGEDRGNGVITFVPYSTQVWLPPEILNNFSNLDDPPSGSLNNAWCHDWYDISQVTKSATQPKFRQNCLVRNGDWVMPYVKPMATDLEEALDYINALTVYGQTHIDLGVRTGALFFDPSLRQIMQASGLVSGDPNPAGLSA